MADANYDEINNKTQLHIKNAYNDNLTEGASYGVVTADGHYYEFDYDTVKNDNVWIPRDLRGQKVVFGEVFEFFVKLSRLMIKQRTNAGIVADDNGRLQLVRLKLNFSISGYFEVHIKHTDKRPDNVYYHTSRILGDTTNRMGVIPMETGTFTVPIMGRNDNCSITIESSKPTAVSFMGYTWEGNYIKRTRNI